MAERRNVVQLIDFDDEDSASVEIDFSENAAVKKIFKELAEKHAENGILKSEDILPPEKLVLRNYQLELLDAPLAGFNTIVCAPTGSGKTIVAVKIIVEHLRSRRQAGTTGKVIFLVPTVNLVDQQSSVVNRYLRGEFTTVGLKGGMTGSNTVPKEMIVNRNDICLMTPQLFLNLLTFDPEIEELAAAKVTDFSLIVFDECHHCDKNHAYNEIMIAYFDAKFDQSKPDLKLPQIIGLTASLGVGQADTMQSARDHILKVCSNLDAQRLALIQRYKDELDEFVVRPKDELVTVHGAHYDHPFSKIIIALMKEIEKKLEPILHHLEDMKIQVPVSKLVPEHRWASIYTSWVYGWYHCAPLLENAEIKRDLTTYVEHLIIYHNCLEINAHVPTRFAFQYLSDEFAIVKRKQTVELDRRLIQLYDSKVQHLHQISENKDIVNPIVKKLKEILLREYKEKEDSRTLIFVRTRELAKSVERYLNSDNELAFLKAGRLTGVNARKDQGGQTEREQQEFLERFRQGEHRVVVATTVAEEGLDIEKCNIVIKYNHVTNEIALVQRRGRGRAEGAKSILLTHENWIEQKEMVNMIREMLMTRTVEHIQLKGDNWFLEEVGKREIQAFKDREIEKRCRDQNRRRLGNKIWELNCKKCDKLITTSAKIRNVQAHYVAIDPLIWSCLTTEPTDKPKLFENLSVAGKVSCLGCRTDCGIVVLYRSVYLPAIKIDALVINNQENNMKKNVKKWKQAIEQCFVVDPIAPAELMPMFHALKPELKDLLNATLQRAAVEQAGKDENLDE